jgi:hypothetical protein
MTNDTKGDFDVEVEADPADIDSNCSLNPIDADGPTNVWCGNDAVTYFFRPAGHRVYACRKHAQQATRFGDDVFGDGAPTLATCKRCAKPTPRRRVNIDGICEKCQA